MDERRQGILKASLTTLIVLLVVTVGFFGIGKYRWMPSLDAPIGYMADAAAMYGMRGIETAGHPFAARTSVPYNHPLRKLPDNIQCYAFSLECTVLRLTGKFTQNPIRIVNIYYILVYYLCALSALYALRRFGIGWLVAAAGAVVFALLPYHFMRNVNHLSLSDYVLIPLFMLVCAWIHDRGVDNESTTGVLPQRLSARDMAFPLVISVLWGLTNDYYAFMFLLFLWFAALQGGNRGRNLRPIYAAAGVTIGLLVSFALRRALVHLSWGKYAGISFGTYQLTGYGEDERYPLKIIQMILPGPHNRIHWLSHLNHIYSNAHPLVNENRLDVLGVVLAIAMLALLIRALVGRSDQSMRDRFLGQNLVFAILLGAMGGLGTIISELSWSLLGPRFPLSQARGWNRIYIFLAFVVVLFLATHADRWLRTLRERNVSIRRVRIPYWVGAAVVVAVTVIALYNQIPPVSKGWLRGNNNRYLVDKAFFGKLDQHYSGSYRVFYWPAMHPWGGQYGKAYYTVAYHPLIASRKLLTSYGAAPNTTAAHWLKATAKEPPKQMLETLCFVKFDGILVYKDALRKRDQTLVKYLQAKLKPLEANKYYDYYSLAQVCKA